ncbi:serine/threonine-protein kinase [Bradyrhizobium sp. AC87j1]|uniref:serine/threonine protein kinase n=1 Tax=Bradyrhizobium sp. AC87j1 TaxID=2055894 RepID=UPI0013753563|nr:serine/threonine-protein kinase [Bradyrhizobium sp. AC87j1]
MPLIANRYEPTGNAAWGGMGELNECEDKNLSRKVMLKRVFKQSDLPRLLDEQKALIRLRSKHVVQLLDVVSFTWNGQDIRCLVLEHISGTDLDKLKFPPGEDYQKTLWQIATGISEIHAAGVIHRDIKPQNIRRDGNGIIKIFDFGLAREAGKDDKTKSIAGTVGYMAPELFGTKTISFTSSIDSFAFARTALALLGIQPHNEKPKAIVPGSIIAAQPTLNPELARTLEACLDLSPASRPSMSEVARLLGRDLLRDKHRARLGTQTNAHELNASKRTVNLAFQNQGSLSIRYDGYEFKITALTGDVYVNNARATVGMSMLSACVITIGSSAPRAFVTFDISNPEVMA